MTVKGLISILEIMRPDALVVIENHDYIVDEVNKVEIDFQHDQIILKK